MGSPSESAEATPAAIGVELLFRGELSCRKEGIPASVGQPQALSPGALAYLGDAIFELFVRSALLVPPQRIQAYHQQVVEQVRAERQVQHLEAWLPRLTEAEITILKRGRNASARGPRRLKPAIYQQATGFETLIGHLYLSDPARLAELLRYIDLTSS